MEFRIRFPVLTVPEEALKGRAKEGRIIRSKSNDTLCLRCGLPLRNPVSKFLLMGPTCLRFCVTKRWDRGEVETEVSKQLQQRGD